MIRKVVIPVAGWGTRSFPASKDIPKEMFPVYNKPVIHYVVEEALAANFKDVVLITNRNKRVIENYFDHNLILENLLERKGKLDLLSEIRQLAKRIDIITIPQKEQLGLGHAVLCAKNVCQEDYFGVMVGDDILYGEGAGMAELVDAVKTHNCSVIGVMEVPKENVDKYGIIDGNLIGDGLYSVNSIVEKPSVDDAPSNLAAIGRYVLSRDIFSYLEKTEAGVGGEIQLTDALDQLAKEGKLLAVKISGQRFDTGDWIEYFMASAHFALQDGKINKKLIGALEDLLSNYKQS